MEEAKEKKVRISKVAAEINIPADQIVDFLKKQGFEVKTLNSVVSTDMMEAINSHFKKEIEKTTKHYQKLEEFNKKLAKEPKEEKPKKGVEESTPVSKETAKKASKAKSKEEEPEAKVGSETTEKPEEILIEKPKKRSGKTKASEILQEIQEEIKTIQTEITKKKEAPKPEIVPEESEVPQAAHVEETKKEEEEIKSAEVVEVPQVTDTTDVGKAKYFVEADEERKKKKGLTVLGKINLEESKVVSTEKPSDTETKEGTPKVVKKRKRPKPKPKKEIVTTEETPASKKRQKVKKFEIDQKEVESAIRKTLLSIDESSLSGRAISRKKKKKERAELEEKRQETRKLEENRLHVTEYIAVNELANLMGVSVSEVIAKCISLGLMVSINQRLDVETITLVADEFGYEIEFEKEYTAEVLEDTPDAEEELMPRSPVVTIMGHVDHGKTSLLDYIRKTNVVAGESGGITQHIGAYKVGIGGEKYITFLDTPGHEAFTAMRARGAQVTDIVILVVAADDAVMPQTIEAISHAQAANVPIIVAINKIDKLGANIDRIKQQLADRKVLVEDWGGKHQSVQVSAKQGTNIQTLLEKVLLEAELLDLRANPNRRARGIVIESEIDKGRGITATILVQKGTLRIGDPFIAGTFYGRVRAMFDERNKKMTEAGPCTPVLVLGFEGAPQAGDTFVVLESERAAREIATKRQQLKRQQDQKQVHHITLDEISKQISIGGVKELPVIVKGDVDGSVEALADSLMKLSKEEVIVRVIHRGVGAISESDVLLAAASNAIIIGFHVRPNINARKVAENQKVDIRLYNIIYDAINEVKSALEGLLSPIISEEITASVEVRDVFKISKIGTVAGCFVTEGKIARSNKIRLVRNGIVIYDGTLLSLKRFKDDVREVDSGYECGLSIYNFNDIKVGDIIEAYKVIETKKKFESN
ncbi:MAG: translation initiation factor IF-2 [Ignavibacteriales bacterium]|nr:translation initiation factor IF-2 [Ignavibacteriales bacterium]